MCILPTFLGAVPIVFATWDFTDDLPLLSRGSQNNLNRCGCWILSIFLKDAAVSRFERQDGRDQVPHVGTSRPEIRKQDISCEGGSGGTRSFRCVFGLFCLVSVS